MDHVDHFYVPRARARANVTYDGRWPTRSIEPNNSKCRKIIMFENDYCCRRSQHIVFCESSTQRFICHSIIIIIIIICVRWHWSNAIGTYPCHDGRVQSDRNIVKMWFMRCPCRSLGDLWCRWWTRHRYLCKKNCIWKCISFSRNQINSISSSMSGNLYLNYFTTT